ncbi:MAG: TRZ/ATZ family hydrolase [Gammaproteobacteria bacterium]|nr:TRZ/ATZ family hydrolase [Gammaproteobacteria bacterium]MBT6079136.1 TRZ/ATZ family hydrolase [Gammaproteobacteria bacterium]
MQTIDTLIHARWVLPIEPANTVLEHHTVAIEGGRILALLPTSEAKTTFQAKQNFELNEHAVMPGLVNSHTHAAMSLLRGLADDLPLMTWLEEHIWPVEGQWVDENFVQDGTELAIAEMLRGGTTCFNDMYFFPEVTAHSAVECGMRAVVGLLMIDFPSAWGSGPEAYLQKGLAIHQQYRNSPLIHTAFAPHSPYTVSNEPLERLQVLAAELELPIHMHIHESAQEVSDSLKQSGLRPLERLDQLGLLGPRLAAVHMTQLIESEIELLAARNVSVIHCPESNMKLASGFCPVHKLMQAGVNVAVGTDGAASNNDLDLLGEMRTASLLAKGVAGDATALTAHQSLQMATLNGARAVGLEQEIGSLLPGKAADLIAIDLSTLESQPLYDVASLLAYATGRHQVQEVWVNGKHLLRQGELVTLDSEKVKRQAKQWRGKIAP